MSFETPTGSSQPPATTNELPVDDLEQVSLTNILNSYEETIGKSELISVGEAGYIINLTDTPPVKGNDWALFDLDDTVISYTEAKTQRLDAYISYMNRSGVYLHRGEAARL